MLQSNPPTSIVPIGALCKADVATVGGKGANLGELARIGAPVPPGFVVTAPVYFRFLEEANLRPQVEQILAGLDVDDNGALDKAAGAIQAVLTSAPMPTEIAAGIVAAYSEMEDTAVAVRSSATAEDLAEASFAGQQDTYLNVTGAAEVVRAVHNCWASLFEPRAIFYRARNRFGQLDVGIAVVVQQMVQSERSGVMFTLHPVTNDPNQLVIEAVYGLGEAIVSGLVTPDTYVIHKATCAVSESYATPQEQELVRNPDTSACVEANHWATIEPDRQTRPKLTVAEAAELAAIGRELEEHFACPQDIEWAYQGGSFYILQSRPVTTAGR